MSPLWVVALFLVQLTTPNGKRHLHINPNEVSTVREPHDGALGHYGKGTNCVLVMANGRFNAVRETCDEVREMIGPGHPLPSLHGPCTLVCGGERP
jgi:hypothetical protein